MRGTIALVGAGRVGQTLARALGRCGYRVGVVVARSTRKARAAVRFIGRGRAASAPNPGLLDADTVLVSVSDARIAIVGRELARVGRGQWRRKVVLHTSGSRTARELAPLRRLGAYCGSLHPLLPFPRPLGKFPLGVFFGIEGDRGAVRRGRELARALGGVAMRAPKRRKVLYHAAGTLVSGHLLTLADLGTRVLGIIGLPERQARRALLPLVRNTIDLYAQLGRRAWTGPLARGDMETVSKHLAALRKLPPHFARVYEVLGRAGLALYRKKSTWPSGKKQTQAIR